MRVVGYTVEDTDGHGIEGVIPLTGLTVLIGRNGTGKTRLVETLASHLDPSAKWRGRHSRIDDEAFPYGFLYLAGEWTGHEDWAWLHSVMAEQDENGDEMAWPPGAELPVWTTTPSSVEDLAGLIAAFLCEDVPEELPIFQEIVRELLTGMLISYQSHELTTIDAIIDTRLVTPDLAGRILHLCGALPDNPVRLPLFEIAAGADRFVRLHHLGTIQYDAFQRLRLQPPAVLSFDASVPNAEAALIAAIGLVVDGYGSDPWLLESKGQYLTDPAIGTWVARLEARMHTLAPDFLLELGTPAVHVPPPALWSSQGRLLLGLRTTIMRRFMDSQQLSAGTLRWLNLLAIIAANDLLAETGAGTPGRAVTWSRGLPAITHVDRRLGGSIFLLDEPEAHLHQTAQQQVTRWLEQLAAAGTSVVVTTHSPSVVSARSPLTTIVSTTRRLDETVTADISGSVLTTLDAEAEELGLDRGAWLSLCQALVLVEGRHDVAVLRRFFADELDTRLIKIIPVRGHRNLTDGTVLAEFFARLGRPVTVMLDDVRSQAISSTDATLVRTSEESVVRQLIHLRTRYPEVSVIPYPDPDIICALPMTALRRAFPAAATVEWDDISSAWRTQDKPPAFKQYALRRLGIRADADALVDRVLSSVQPGDPAGEALDQAVRLILRRVDETAAGPTAH